MYRVQSKIIHFVHVGSTGLRVATKWTFRCNRSKTPIVKICFGAKGRQSKIHLFFLCYDKGAGGESGSQKWCAVLSPEALKRRRVLMNEGALSYGRRMVWKYPGVMRFGEQRIPPFESYLRWRCGVSIKLTRELGVARAHGYSGLTPQDPIRTGFRHGGLTQTAAPRWVRGSHQLP